MSDIITILIIVAGVTYWLITVACGSVAGCLPTLDGDPVAATSAAPSLKRPSDDVDDPEELARWLKRGGR